MDNTGPPTHRSRSAEGVWTADCVCVRFPTQARSARLPEEGTPAENSAVQMRCPSIQQRRQQPRAPSQGRGDGCTAAGQSRTAAYGCGSDVWPRRQAGRQAGICYDCTAVQLYDCTVLVHFFRRAASVRYCCCWENAESRLLLLLALFCVPEILQIREISTAVRVRVRSDDRSRSS
jgi:hypothetical protein